jgi:glycosyltransferase involved in cell wall biosynthesis
MPVPEITVDGVRYTPASEQPSRIGVGITTHGRRAVFERTLTEIRRRTPGAKIVVVDDASDTPVPEASFRFEVNVGIARAKNKCLELLADCEHIFLFDDDAYPLVDDWWRPYVESPEPHLMYVFQEFAGKGPRLNDCTILADDGQHIAYSTPRGVMLYIDRNVLDQVGGMDIAFGQWGYEHGDWSNRIHAAGLTTWRYADVRDSQQLIYSLDEHVYELGGHERSVPHGNRTDLVERNKTIHDAQRNLPAYREYRQQRDVVLTAYLSGVVDPQRRKVWPDDSRQLAPLLTSLAGHDVVLFSNELSPMAVETVRVAKPVSPYFDRWLHYYRWLRDHPEVRFVWCVDSTDVVLLREPFDLEPGVLYVGSEATVTGTKWMRENSTDQAWIDAHASDPLLNCGLVGGDRRTVMTLCHRMVRAYYDAKADGTDLILDMGPFNRIVRDEFTFTTGPAVHTTFRANETNDWSRWKHK